uniref:Uncharacterized protein n=1 Tax=Leersia perrieri TaxID=77586 RepID=A0A0D9WR17_9ORYZ
MRGLTCVRRRNTADGPAARRDRQTGSTGRSSDQGQQRRGAAAAVTIAIARFREEGGDLWGEGKGICKEMRRGFAGKKK